MSPFKDKEQKREYQKKYWQQYYKLNRQKILAKNTTWGKAEKGKEYRRNYNRDRRQNANSMVKERAQIL